MSEKINKDFIDEACGMDGPPPKRIQVTPEEEPELRKTVFDSLKELKPVEVIDTGEIVICDWCGKDYTDPPESEKCGGLLFGSKAACPDCAHRIMENAKKYNEENCITGICPTGMTFKNWVIKLRGGDNTIKLYTF